jgi:hypothetical protein
MVPKIARLADPIVSVAPVKIPLQIDEPEPVIQKPTPAKARLVEELKKLQIHDPTVVPVRGEGMGGSSPTSRDSS